MYGSGVASFCLEPELTQVGRSQSRLQDLGHQEPEPPKKVVAPQHCFLLTGVQRSIIDVDFLRAYHHLLKFLKTDTDKLQFGLPRVSSVDMMEGGCARACGDHSTTPGTSTPSLPTLVGFSSSSTSSLLPPLPNIPVVGGLHYCFWSFRVLSILPNSCLHHFSSELDP